jgi:hypothetical protein
MATKGEWERRIDSNPNPHRDDDKKKPQMRDIPQDWIRDYVDKILALAKEFPDESLMRTTCLLRAEHAMDLVKSFRESA